MVYVSGINICTVKEEKKGINKFIQIISTKNGVLCSSLRLL